MFIKRSYLLGLSVFGAAFGGWMLNSTLDDVGAESRVSAAPMSASVAAETAPTADGPPPSTTPQTIVLSLTLTDDRTVPPPVAFTIVNAPPGSSPSPVESASGGQDEVHLENSSAVDEAGTPPARSVSSQPTSVSQGSSGVAGRTAVQPTRVVAPQAAVPLKQPAQSRQVVVFKDSHIVIASDGSIVLVGDNADLRANTGEATGGIVALDVAGSDLTSVSRGIGTPAGDAGSGQSAISAGEANGRAVSVAGYEDHSVNVLGNDQIILYDDSNVIIDRDGTVNANTGDTDSSGLNVVDATNSVVRAGNSGDGEGSAEDEDEDAEADVGDADDEANEDAEDLAEDRENLDVADSAPSPEVLTDGSPALTSTGVSAAAAPPSGGRASASVVDDDVSTSASGDDVTVIGGDGFDDLAIRSVGHRNVVVYDDSNLVIGGHGPVNAQIGDSDTGGAVVMGVRDSYIEAGCEGDLCPLYDD